MLDLEAEHPGVCGRYQETRMKWARKKVNVNERRKVRRPQLIEKAGSPHWTISATG
jgi:hypothetical protein